MSSRKYIVAFIVVVALEDKRICRPKCIGDVKPLACWLFEIKTGASW